MNDYITQKLTEYAERHLAQHGHALPAHNRESLRLVLEREYHANELSNSDYRAADEGMYWSDK